MENMQGCDLPHGGDQQVAPSASIPGSENSQHCFDERQGFKTSTQVVTRFIKRSQAPGGSGSWGKGCVPVPGCGGQSLLPKSSGATDLCRLNSKWLQCLGKAMQEPLNVTQPNKQATAQESELPPSSLHPPAWACTCTHVPTSLLLWPQLITL